MSNTPSHPVAVPAPARKERDFLGPLLNHCILVVCGGDMFSDDEFKCILIRYNRFEILVEMDDGKHIIFMKHAIKHIIPMDGDPFTSKYAKQREPAKLTTSKIREIATDFNQTHTYEIPAVFYDNQRGIY